MYKDLRKVRRRRVVSLQPRHKGCLSGVGEGHHQIEVTGIVPVPRSVAGGVENARKEPPLFCDPLLVPISTETSRFSCLYSVLPSSDNPPR